MVEEWDLPTSGKGGLLSHEPHLDMEQPLFGGMSSLAQKEPNGGQEPLEDLANVCETYLEAELRADIPGQHSEALWTHC